MKVDGKRVPKTLVLQTAQLRPLAVLSQGQHRSLDAALWRFYNEPERGFEG